MFEKFGELNSFGEINELAENLFNEGDTESLKAMAKENGIQNEFVQMYLQGDIPVLCDPLTAAMGKIDVEVAELKPQEIMEDWVEYLNQDDPAIDMTLKVFREGAAFPKKQAVKTDNAKQAKAGANGAKGSLRKTQKTRANA